MAEVIICEEQGKSPFKTLVVYGHVIVLLGLGVIFYFTSKPSPVKREFIKSSAIKTEPSAKKNLFKLCATENVDNEPIAKLEELEGFLRKHKFSIFAAYLVLVPLIAYGSWYYLEELEREKVTQELLEKMESLEAETAVLVNERMSVLHRVAIVLISGSFFGVAYTMLESPGLSKVFIDTLVTPYSMLLIYLFGGWPQLLLLLLLPTIVLIAVFTSFYMTREIGFYEIYNFLAAIFYVAATGYFFVISKVEYSILAFGVFLSAHLRLNKYFEED